MVEALEHYIERGQQFLSAGMLEAGERILREAALAYSHPVVLNTLAATLFALDRLPEARDIIDDAIRLFPDYPLSYQKQGILHLMNEDWCAAETSFSRALSLWDSDYSRSLLAFSLLMQNQTHACMRQCRKIRSRRPELFLVRALLCRWEGKHLHALNLLDRAGETKDCPLFQAAWDEIDLFVWKKDAIAELCNHARRHVAMGRFTRAKSCLRAALRYDENFDAVFAFEEICADSSRDLYDRQIEKFEVVVANIVEQLQKQNWIIAYRRALKVTEQAHLYQSDTWNRIALLLPDLKDAAIDDLLAKAEASAAAGDVKKAERCFRQALIWNPESIVVLQTVARYAVKQRRVTAAIELLEIALNLQERQSGIVANLSILADLADCCFQNHQTQLACEYYSRLLRFDPGNALAIARMNALNGPELPLSQTKAAAPKRHLELCQ